MKFDSKNIKEAEKCNSFFLRGFASNTRISFNEVYLEDGSISTNDDIIAETHSSAWEDHFSSNVDPNESINLDQQEYILRMIERNPNKVNDTQFSSLEEDISFTELVSTINHLKDGKAAGYDGLTAEVYKLHADIWASIDT